MLCSLASPTPPALLASGWCSEAQPAQTSHLLNLCSQSKAPQVSTACLHGLAPTHLSSHIPPLQPHWKCWESRTCSGLPHVLIVRLCSLPGSHLHPLLESLLILQGPSAQEAASLEPLPGFSGWVIRPSLCFLPSTPHYCTQHACMYA